MDVTEYDKVTLTNFNGLYKRGIDDNCPPDHSTISTNVIYRRGQFSTRYGSAPSKYQISGTTYTYNWTVVRMFIGSIDAVLTPITLDTTGKIRYNTTVILNDARITDFVGLNMFNRTYILPIIPNGPTSGLKMRVITDNTPTFRDAIGFPPEASIPMGALQVAGGNIPLGVHYFAVSYVTDSGFTTNPGPWVPNYATGLFTPTGVNNSDGTKVNLFDIPLGPAGHGIIGRQIFSTQADLLTFYYVPNGYIPDNTTTTLTVDFFDTDLVVSADNLFDQMTDMPAALGIGGLDKYHGRMIELGSFNDLVRVSDAGNPESFNTLTGWIQIPSENDGNVVSSTFHINDNLYFTKPIGIFVTPDNGSDPSSWTVIPVDGGTGSMGYGTSSITASQAHLTTAEAVLISDLDGLFVFNGVVLRPPLTYKINDVWKAHVNLNNLNKITVFGDPFNEEFYVQVPGFNSILVGNYGDGLDPQSIKWSTFDFSEILSTIAMASLPDDEFVYCLRVAFTGSGFQGIYKYHTGLFGDTLGNSPSTFNIPTIWASAMVPMNLGGVNVFRGIRARMLSQNTSNTLVNPSVSIEDTNPVNLPSWSVANKPALDYFRQLNVMNEKLTVQIANSDTHGIVVQRIDLFGKLLFPARPA